MYQNHPHPLFFSKILSFYLIKNFFFSFLFSLSGVSLLISLFDFLDLLRRAASHPDVSFLQILTLAALHLPYYLIYIFPFAMLLGGIASFTKLARSSEIIIMRSAGLSAFQCIFPPILCAITLGIITITCLTPLSSYCYQKGEIYDETWLKQGHGPMSLHHQKLWIRQNDNALTPNGIDLIKIEDISQNNDILDAQSITIFRLDTKSHLLQRIFAKNGTFIQKKWHFYHPMLLSPITPPQKINDIILNSELTIDYILSISAPPDTHSLWDLPYFIHILKKSGFPTRQQQLKLHSLLALPILAGTMVLVSAGFTLYSTRRNGITHLLGAGISLGFALFTISKIAEQLGKSGALPPILAAWVPTLAGLCFAASLLLHMEDG